MVIGYFTSFVFGVAVGAWGYQHYAGVAALKAEVARLTAIVNQPEKVSS